MSNCRNCKHWSVNPNLKHFGDCQAIPTMEERSRNTELLMNATAFVKGDYLRTHSEFSCNLFEQKITHELIEKEIEMTIERLRKLKMSLRESD